jgi:AbrB family looped-hinge helix DNA binding protein
MTLYVKQTSLYLHSPHRRLDSKIKVLCEIEGLLGCTCEDRALSRTRAQATVSSKYRIVIPLAAREALSLSAGDQLLVLCKTDRLVIIPKPKSFAKRTAGLHRDIWQGADTYLTSEREQWKP